MAPDPRREPRPEDPADRPPEADGSGTDSEEWQPRPNDFLVEPMFAPFEGAGNGGGERSDGGRSGAGDSSSGDSAAGSTADGKPRAFWARLRAILGLE